MQFLSDLINCVAANHYSAQFIADRAGLDRKTVAAILSGETDNPRVQSLCAIAKVLNARIVFQTELARSSVDSSYYIKCLADKQQLIDDLRANQQKIEDNVRETIRYKDMWLLRLFILCLVLIAVSITLAAVAFT